MSKLSYLLFSIVLLGATTATPAGAAERVILDTDLGDDVDDAGTLAVFHALADRGEIIPLAIGVVNGNVNAVPLTDAINTWYGRPNLPVGTIKSGAPINRNTFKMGEIAAQYPHDLTQASAPDVVGLYRSILAQQPDASVILVVVGQATNIANLLKSQPDAYSTLTGVELVRRKIKFYAWGGNGRNTLPSGASGWNYQNDRTSASYELINFPDTVPMSEGGGDGLNMYAGSCYQQAPVNHIIRKCYEAYYGGPARDRNVWDQLRLMYGAMPALRSKWTKSADGNITLDVSNGNMTWAATPNRRRSWAAVNDRAGVLAEMNALMMHANAVGSSIRVNFQPAAAAVPAGYLVDSGAMFGDRGNGQSYGWNGSANNQTRDRGTHPEQRYDTLNHMQNSGANRMWEIAVPSGSYRVHLVMGDPRYADQTNNVFIEGQLQSDPDGRDLIDEYDATVAVSDGRLSIHPDTTNGTVGAKILFVEITASQGSRLGGGPTEAVDGVDLSDNATGEQDDEASDEAGCAATGTQGPMTVGLLALLGLVLRGRRRH